MAEGRLSSAACLPRRRVPFSAVNRCGMPGHDPALQKHHLLPCQLLSRSCFAAMFETLDARRIGFNDFRRNGLLLPAREEAAQRLALPLHRGPHRTYNQMVIQRVGEIERGWSRLAAETALMRLALLQRALRRRLLDHRRPLRLNRSDRLGKEVDFSELDAMADSLWRATAP
ncbi:MAG: AHH domain-containing protein [Pseudomonadota bacterium]|nr:AHH domain-containing protein [Pseudomonadota bacterium]